MMPLRKSRKLVNPTRLTWLLDVDVFRLCHVKVGHSLGLGRWGTLTRASES